MLEAAKSLKMTRVRLLFLTVAFGLMALAASPALAHVGNYWHDVPDHVNADADVKITTWRVPGTSYGSIYLDNRYGLYPVYVQARPVFDSYWRTDGYWKKVATASARTSGTVGWSDTTYSSYNAYEFRICRDIPSYPDTCGSSVGIRP